MTDQPEPRPLADAALLAWAVVLGYRERQERDGIKILALPFPPCPTCGETVHKAVASWVREPFREEVAIDVQPCGHAHTATFADLERIHDHASEMLASLRLDDRLPGGEGRSTDDIVREAHARVEPEPAGTEGAEATQSTLQALIASTLATCPDISTWDAMASSVLAAIQPHLAGHYQHAVDAAVAAEQRAVQAEARLRRYRDWLAAQHANAVRADQAGGVPDDLKISPHNGIAAGLHTALLGLDRILAAHNAGPTVAECAEADARWWADKYAGEGQ